MATRYPPVGFHFSVKFDQIGSGSDEAFQSVSGLSVDIETEEIKVGGENRFTYKFPGRTKFPNLVLKRGMLFDSGVIDWCRNAIENFEFKPVDVQVTLLNENHDPLVVWDIVHAYPVKWNVDEFSALDSKLVVETIELCYNYFKVSKGQSSQ